MDNVIAVIFKNESDGYQLITELRNAPRAEQAVIIQMALVKRDESGINVCDSYDGIAGSAGGTVIGGLTGGLVGILGGPIGVLLMGSAGMLTGSLVDLGGSTAGIAMIETVADKLAEGDVALIILAEEEDEAYLDEKISKFPAEIVRFDAASVSEEVEEATLMQMEMSRQARMQLRKTLREDTRERLKERREERKAELEADFEEYKKNLDL